MIRRGAAIAPLVKRIDIIGLNAGVEGNLILAPLGENRDQSVKRICVLGSQTQRFTIIRQCFIAVTEFPKKLATVVVEMGHPCAVAFKTVEFGQGLRISAQCNVEIPTKERGIRVLRGESDGFIKQLTCSLVVSGV